MQCRPCHVWSLVPHTTTLLISWNGSAIVVDAIFANNLLQFRRQLRFVLSTTDIKCQATTNHRFTSVCQTATVAHPVHRAYGYGGELQEEAFSWALQLSRPRAVFTHGVWPVAFFIMRIFSPSHNWFYLSLIFEMTKKSAGQTRSIAQGGK